jgi:hypothetical protein
VQGRNFLILRTITKNLKGKMNSLKIEPIVGTDGYVHFQNPTTGQFFYPCDEYGNLQAIGTRDLQRVKHVRQITSLGWIDAVIQAGTSIFSTINRSQAQKKADAAALQLLDRQARLEELRTQGDLAILQAQKSLQDSGTWSAGKVIGVAVGGAAILGGVIFLITRAEKKKSKK